MMHENAPVWRRQLAVLCLLAVIGCVERNARYCGDGVCTNPAFPFCDIDGSLAGEPKTCIAVACTPEDFVACRGDQAITCDTTGNNYHLVQCERGCDDAIGCNECTSGSCVVIAVSPTGDDSGDGVTSPVKTLKRAIGLAAANPQVTRISLGTGRYDAAHGETYPYAVPDGVVVAGPAGGGAVLVGTATDFGLTLRNGKLHDLETEGFQVAIVSRGPTELTRIRVRNAGVAVRGETAANLTVTQLDITGSDGTCATGIELLGNATLLVTDLTTQKLGTTLSSVDASAATVARATVTGVASCQKHAFVVRTTSTFALNDSVVEGSNGVFLRDAPALTQATITNTTLRDTFLTGTTARLTMIGGQFSNASIALLGGGEWTFMSVAITPRGPDQGIYAQGSSVAQTKLTVRGSTFMGGSFNIYLSGQVSADLGTAASTGNNVFRGSTGQGVGADSCLTRVEAAGNTWRPGVQGADAMGRYPVASQITGPVPQVAGNNFSLDASCSILR